MEPRNLCAVAPCAHFIVRSPSLSSPSNDPLGVILTGGRATRLRPLSNFMPKSLIPLLNRPLISYSLDLLAGAGVREVVVVVGPDDDRTGPAAREWAPEVVEVSVAVQHEPRGSGDALISAGAALDGRRVVVAAVDAVLRGPLRPHVDAFLESGRDGWLILHETDRPREMGIVVLDGDRASYFEEKPDDPPSNLALVGVWMVGPAVVERLRRDPKLSPRGEVELSGTMADMRREGTEIGGSVFDGDWLDTGTLRSLLDTQRALLDGAGAPLIAAGSTVEKCTLGPNVVVGSGAVLRSVTLDDALVAPGAHLEGIEARGVVVTPDGEVTQVED